MTVSENVQQVTTNVVRRPLRETILWPAGEHLTVPSFALHAPRGSGHAKIAVGDSVVAYPRARRYATARMRGHAAWPHNDWPDDRWVATETNT
jgi:hypothetical protein